MFAQISVHRTFQCTAKTGEKSDTETTNLTVDVMDVVMKRYVVSDLIFGRSAGLLCAGLDNVVRSGTRGAREGGARQALFQAGPLVVQV